MTPAPEDDLPDRRTPYAAAGAQAERTGLAWHRTGLVLAGTAGLLLHASDDAVRPLRVATLVGLVAAAAALLVSGRRRSAVLRQGVDGSVRAPSARLVTALGLAGTVLGVAALGLALDT